MIDTSMPPELRAYLDGKADSDDPKERSLSTSRKLWNWAATEYGMMPHLSVEQMEEIKSSGRQKIARAILHADAGFFREIADALETENHCNLCAIKDCVAHVYLGERLSGKPPSRAQVKKEALELCARQRIVMRRLVPMPKSKEAFKTALLEEEKRVPAEVANLKQSVNWPRMWRELGLNNPSYIQKSNGRPKGSKNI